MANVMNSLLLLRDGAVHFSACLHELSEMHFVLVLVLINECTNEDSRQKVCCWASCGARTPHGQVSLNIKATFQQ